ncbi:MAG TPA: kinase [Patescibacteria group bacterium]|nr:kinase [Patescibacteria group bacterium]
MVISRTPFRISFFGGGTDYPSWVREHGGTVLATTINKYCYLNVRYLPPFFWHKYRIVYSKNEMCNLIDEIQHPAVREVIRFLKIPEGLAIHHDGDLPARSGLGSSSALTVGLLNALYALRGQMISKQQLARESIQIEQEILKETVGYQDQTLASYGGFNHITFEKNGNIIVDPMTLPATRMNELEDHLMLFYTGIPRIASKIAKSYVKKIDNQEEQLSIMQSSVAEAIAILNSKKDIKHFGVLLDEFWKLKRSLSTQVSNPEIDDIYKKARNAGATGGKLIGAGGGGFLLLFVPPRQQIKVREKLKKLVYVPFKFEHEGSQIISFDPEEDYSRSLLRRKIKR